MSPLSRAPNSASQKLTPFKTPGSDMLTSFKIMKSDTLTHFKTHMRSKEMLTSFKTLVKRVTKLNPRYMVPVNEACLVISDPQRVKAAPQPKEQPTNWSTTKRIEIQSHLCRARFNIYPEYKGSSSIVSQQLQLHW